MSLSEDFIPVFSIKSDIFQTIKLVWQSIELKDFYQLDTFWDFHRKTKFWYWIHPTFKWRKLFRFDSGIVITDENEDSYTVTATITQNKKW